MKLVKIMPQTLHTTAVVKHIMPHKVMAINIVSHATRLNRLPMANSPPKVLRLKCVKRNLCIA